MAESTYPLVFNDGKQGYHKGVVSISHTTSFRNFLLQVSERVPGLDPQHFHIVIVCSRANAPADARQYIPIHETTNFSVVMNQHSPVSDSAAHFLVTLKRPEQRQLDQQRKANCMQQPIGMGTQGQQQSASHQAAHQAAHQAGPPRRQQGLTGAAYPWAGMSHPPVTPQMQQAWNAAQEPHTVQGHMSRRPANMWGAVPQHHHAVPPAQAQHSQLHHSHAQHSTAQHSHAQHSQAQAQQFALAQAAAQAHAMRQAEGMTPPPPPPNPQMGGFGHASHMQAAHAQAPAAFQAAQHAQHPQQAQHAQGFVVPPPPPPTNPGFGSAPRGPCAPPGLSENFNRGSIPAVHMHQGSPAWPQGMRPQQPCPSPRMQPADLPFRPTRILTHANSGRLGSRPSRAGQHEAQEPFKAEDMPCSPIRTPPGFGRPSGFASLPHLKTSGSAPLEDDFWCSSPCDHVLHPFLIKKHNPFGAVSSPRSGTPTGATPAGDAAAVNHRGQFGQADRAVEPWENARVFIPAARVLAPAAFCHDQGLR